MGAERQRFAPHNVRAESLGYVEMCEVYRRGESSQGAGRHEAWTAV